MTTCRAYRSLNKQEDYPLIAGLLRAGLGSEEIAEKFDVSGPAIRRLASADSPAFSKITGWSESDAVAYKSTLKRRVLCPNPERQRLMLRVASLLRSGTSPAHIAKEFETRLTKITRWANGEIHAFSAIAEWTDQDVENYRGRRWKCRK